MDKNEIRMFKEYAKIVKTGPFHKAKIVIGDKGNYFSNYASEPGGQMRQEDYTKTLIKILREHTK